MVYNMSMDDLKLAREHCVHKKWSRCGRRMILHGPSVNHGMKGVGTMEANRGDMREADIKCKVVS